MRSLPDDEQNAIIALRDLCTQRSKNKLPTTTARGCDQALLARAKTNINQRCITVSRKRSSTSLRVILPILAFFLTGVTLAGVVQGARYFVLPVILLLLKQGQTVLIGNEQGVQCTVWATSPLQQFRCMMVSFTNGYVITLMNDMVRELFSQKWTTFVPTCIGYLCTGSGALYSAYVYGVRRFLMGALRCCFCLYRTFYLALNNPMMPFDYIEQSMMVAE